MALITAKTLVLCDATVLVGGKADLRLGGRYQAPWQQPAIPFAMRHPSHGCLFMGTATRVRHDHVVNDDEDAAVLRAGRPDSLAGDLGRSERSERPTTSTSWQKASKRRAARRTPAARARGIGAR
jgi:hypothetical protein